MIEAAIVAMTVMGCNHQDMNCELIPRQTTVWHSAKECWDAIPSEIVKPTEAPYPVIIARCDAGGRIAALDGADQQATVSTNHTVGDPVVIIATGDFERLPQAGQDRTIGGALLYRTKNGYALVRQGAADSFATLRDGVIGGYVRLRNGVRLTASATGQLAKRTADAVKTIIRLPNHK